MSHWKSFAPQFSPFYGNSLFWLIINFHIKRITHRDTKIISKEKKNNLQFHKQFCQEQLALFGNNNNNSKNVPFIFVNELFALQLPKFSACVSSSVVKYSLLPCKYALLSK